MAQRSMSKFVNLEVEFPKSVSWKKALIMNTAHRSVHINLSASVALAKFFLGSEIVV